MAAYVLVPGGGTAAGATGASPGSCGRPDTTSAPPALTGIGERSHLLSTDSDLDFHINDVIQILAYQNLSNVIPAGHSYGAWSSPASAWPRGSAPPARRCS
jgi:hypothetical protein